MQPFPTSGAGLGAFRPARSAALGRLASATRDLLLQVRPQGQSALPRFSNAGVTRWHISRCVAQACSAGGPPCLDESPKACPASVGPTTQRWAQARGQQHASATASQPAAAPASGAHLGDITLSGRLRKRAVPPPPPAHRLQPLEVSHVSAPFHRFVLADQGNLQAAASGEQGRSIYEVRQPECKALHLTSGVRLFVRN